MTRPPLSERRRTHTRREIAESAVTLFARDGYDNVSVEDIAEEAGISLRTFYRYFSAKDEVLSPIVTQATPRHPPPRPPLPPQRRPPLDPPSAHLKRLDRPGRRGAADAQGIEQDMANVAGGRPGPELHPARIGRRQGPQGGVDREGLAQ